MTDAPLAKTFPLRTPKGPRKPRDPDAPAHYRLSKETWALILAEYREGATAPELALKWRVSQHALRKQITRAESTKRDWGDAQAIEQAAARDAMVEDMRRNSPEAVAERLFDGIELDDEKAGDPVALARVATRASGRAMTGRLWAEARALAGLAESYTRLSERVQGPDAVRQAEYERGGEMARHWLDGFERGREKTLAALGVPYDPEAWDEGGDLKDEGADG